MSYAVFPGKEQKHQLLNWCFRCCHDLSSAVPPQLTVLEVSCLSLLRKEKQEGHLVATLKVSYTPNLQKGCVRVFDALFYGSN